MKKFILSFLTGLFFTTGFAQKVTLQKEVVYKEETPFCRLVKQGSGAHPRLSVSSINDPEIELIVAQFKEAQNLYKVSFTESGAVCNMPAGKTTAETFAEDLVYNRVFVDGQLNPKGENLFLRQYEDTPAETEIIPGLKKVIGSLEDAVSEILTDGPPAKRGANDKNYETVERDHTRPILLAGRKIMQGSQQIGQYFMTSKTVDGLAVRVISVALPNGEKIAEATLDATAPASAKMVILKNSQVVDLPLTTSVETEQVKKLATYLSGRFLL